MIGRRRKIRCVLVTPSKSTCKHCASQGIVCVEQRRDSPRGGRIKTQHDLQERVARLESLLHSSLAREDESSSYEGFPRHTAPSPPSSKAFESHSSTPLLDSHSSSEALETPPGNADPISDLFNNGIVSLIIRKRSHTVTTC